MKKNLSLARFKMIKGRAEWRASVELDKLGFYTRADTHNKAPDGAPCATIEQYEDVVNKHLGKLVKEHFAS